MDSFTKYVTGFLIGLMLAMGFYYFHDCCGYKLSEPKHDFATGKSPYLDIDPTMLENDIKLSTVMVASSWSRCSGTIVKRDGKHIWILCSNQIDDGKVDVVFNINCSMVKVPGEILFCDPSKNTRGCAVVKAESVYGCTIPKLGPKDFIYNEKDTYYMCGFDEKKQVNFDNVHSKLSDENLICDRPCKNGNSGGGIFNSNMQLIGIIWGRDGNPGGKTYCTPIKKLYESLEEHKSIGILE